MNHITNLFKILLLLAPLSTFAANCESSVFQQLATSSPYGIKLNSAKIVEGAVDYCEVAGTIANAEDGQSQINFRVNLPAETTWNRKFLVTGNGGTAGFFQGANQINAALELGYATAQTDTGHISIRGEAENWVMKETDSGVMLPNNVALDDFSHRAIHLTTIIGKQFVDRFYAHTPEHSYYYGCSTGGRQGLRAMQSYPNDFDGIIAGAPVYSLTRLNMSQLWLGQQVDALNAKEESLSNEQLASIKEAVLSNCDGLDGLTDRIIQDPRQCKFDPAVLSCESTGSSSSCLTDTQIDFVRAVYHGPVTATGERIYPGTVPGGESGGRRGGWQTFLTANCTNDTGSGRCDYLARAWFQNPELDLLNEFSINLADQVAAADSTYFSSVSRADNPDVTPFVQSGGKAILYHGWADTNVTPYPTIELYEAMENTVSRKRGEADFHEHVRLFMAPGMGHCQGGDGPNNYFHSALEAIDQWVVNGTAPESIIATHDQRGISRPWCPYPKVARLKVSTSNPNEAENFHCVTLQE